jgi:hypothetical protein
MKRLSTVSISLLLGVAIWLALRPVTVAEAVLWNDLVRPQLRGAFFAPDAWSGWMYAVIAKRAIGLIRLSEFSLRIPALLAGVVFLLTLPRRLWAVLAAAVAVGFGWFSTAGGPGLALGFCAAAWRWRSAAPWLLGLAVAAYPPIAIPLLAVALWRGIDAIEHFAVPALVTAFILLIVPLSHAGPVAAGREEGSVRDAVEPLRGHPMRIATPPATAPLYEFYKARYRQRDWEIVIQRGQTGGFQPVARPAP